MHSTAFDESLVHKHFSHIYIEKGAENYPDTRLLLDKYPHAVHIVINDYKDVFNRPNQRFQFQKQSMKLILAVKKDRFFYEASDQVQNFDHRHRYYNSLILNCIYNCDYCYLQGMYPSANVVVFVNSSDFFESTKKQLSLHPMYLCISYDTDLLAFEHVVPFCSRWISFASEEHDLTIELRTKSVNYKSIAHLKPASNVILAWTISPQEIIDAYEKGTPSLKSRLGAVESALKDGWPVRLCFDPVIRTEGWEEIYSACVKETFSRIPAEGVSDVSLGVFRMNSEYLQRIQKQRTDSDLLYYPFETNGKTISYPASERERMIGFMTDTLQAYIPKEKIFL